MSDPNGLRFGSPDRTCESEIRIRLPRTYGRTDGDSIQTLRESALTVTRTREGDQMMVVEVGEIAGECVRCGRDLATTPSVHCCVCGKPTQSGHCHPACTVKISVQLRQIGEYVLDAYAAIEPQRTGQAGSPSFGSKPPINVAAVDPELTLIELTPGDPTSAEPILNVLEMWERGIREDRRLSPYGVASAARATMLHTVDTQTTLFGCLEFLRTHLDWCATSHSFKLGDFATDIRRAHAALKHFDPNLTATGVRVPCPTVTDTTECRFPLTITSSDDVDCKRCGRTWTVDYLTRVAGAHADAYTDAEALARMAGVNERTIRKWHRKGLIGKRGNRYSVQDVKTLIETQPVQKGQPA